MSTKWTQADIDRLKANGISVAQVVKGPLKIAAPTPQQRHQALGRLKPGEMNKTEEKYSQKLEALKTAGNVLKWWFGCMNLKLADKCFYRIDFLVLMSNGELEVHEIKGGYITDDSLVKVKVAAEMYPFKFKMMQHKGGYWIEREF